MSEKDKTGKHLITGVNAGSIADELGIKTGDYVIRINGVPVNDVFDYKTAVFSEDLSIEIETVVGEAIEFDIEKDEDEDIGLTFESYLMDKNCSCKNKCIFCFIDQLPEGLRKSLYFKDDDIRLSFLSGNYVTLTNVSDAQLDRIISYRLSPVNVSVHATNPDLRIKMMNSKDAGKLMEQLKKITDSGIEVNCQIVLCPQINDGIELENTIKDLYDLGERIKSISIVPVGITKFRGKNNLFRIHPLGLSGAKNVLKTVINWQQIFLTCRGSRVIFAADEIYIKAQTNLPSSEEYDDFPQLENGVGMTSLFIKELEKGLSVRKKEISAGLIIERTSGLPKGGNVFLVTGKDAAPFIARFEEKLESVYKRKFVIKMIPNSFFGENVSVAGLVTGNDIIKTLALDKELENCETIIIPKCMLRSGEEVFLDDITVENIKDCLKRKVVSADSTAQGLLDELDRQFTTKVKGGNKNG